ncbi:hypothetical protein V2J09_008795 [Rumex salicifolius]
MASGTRSSKRKSSPSIRKKRRIKDRSKKRSKTVKGKFKKVHRRESPDSYSDNESLSSASSVSYSSTDSDIRRSRSRIRKDTSKNRKKSRGSRLRSKSIDNTIVERKGNRSKKSKGTDAKKKRLKKKRKREPSISSSSRPVSCSTCRSSDDSEGENQNTEKRLKKRERGKSRRDLVDDRRWGSHRSRSCSPCRLDGVDGSYLSVEQRFVENNPRRLRSIIIFAKEFEEEEDTELIDRDVHKEEIICDQDDYPSPRSNDSHDLEDQHGKIAGILDSIEVCEANVSSAEAGSNAVDLEAVLRQKALENLKKFKGGMRPNAKKPICIEKSTDGESKQSSSLNANLELLKKDQEGSVGCTMADSSAFNESAAEILPILIQDSKMVNLSEEDRLEGGVGEVSALEEGNLKEDKFAKQALPPQEPPLINMLTTESLSLLSRNAKGLADSVDDIKDKHETVELQRLASHKLRSQMISIEESSMLMSVPTESKDTVESVQPSNDAKLITNDIEKTATEVIDTSLASNLEGQSSNPKGKEDGDSQFQKKTMSVMRGGEMVQFSCLENSQL